MKNSFKILVAVAMLTFSVGTGGARNGQLHVVAVSDLKDSTSTATMNLADSLVCEGMKLLGRPYHYGSGGPKSFDCSGFTSHVYRKFGYTLDHSSSGQSRQGRKIEGPWSNLQKGDLVIFTARHNSTRIGHVGIFIELDSTGKDFTFIHAAVQGGVIISHITEPYYSSRYVGACRVLPDIAKPSEDTSEETNDK